MASRKGQTIADIFNEVQAINQAWSVNGASLVAKLATDTGADNFINGMWHDARRTKERITALTARVNTLGATPALGRQALRDYAETQYGATYDILGETTTFIGLLDALQAAVETLVPVDGQGFVTAPYIRLSDTPPYFTQVTPAQSAGVATALQNIVDHIID